MRFYKVALALLICMTIVAACALPGPRVGIGQKPDKPIRPLPPTDSGPSVYFAALTIETIPSGALIYLDDQAKGVTPMRLDALQPGAHNVRLQLDGYKDYENRVFLQQGEVRPLQISLTANQKEQRLGLSPSK